MYMDPTMHAPQSVYNNINPHHDVHNTINIFTSVYMFLCFICIFSKCICGVICLVPMQFRLSPTSSVRGQAILTLLSK